MVLPDIASPSEGDYIPLNFLTILAGLGPVNDSKIGLHGFCCNGVAPRPLWE